MRKLAELSFNLLVATVVICSIATISGLLISVGGFAAWTVFSPFVANAQCHQLRAFATQSFIATLPFFGGCIAISLTANALVEAESKRSKRQARLKLSQQLNQQEQGYSIAATNSLIFELADTQRRVRDLELRLNDRIDAQVRLLNRLSELEEAVYGDSTATDFYPAEPRSDVVGSARRCRYLNEELIRCAVHPTRLDCEGCRDYCERES